MNLENGLSPYFILLLHNSICGEAIKVISFFNTAIIILKLKMKPEIALELSNILIPNFILLLGVNLLNSLEPNEMIRFG